MIDESVFKEQNLKIEKYEKKLKALIQAYKSLLAEKTALEQTLSALSQAEEHHVVKPGKVLVNLQNEFGIGNSPDKEHSVDSSGHSDDSSMLTINNTLQQAESREESSLSKFNTIKKALATITAEKTKQEAAFTEDRKRLIAEKEVAEEKLKNQIEENDGTKKRYERMLQEIKDYCRELEAKYSALEASLAEKNSAADNFDQMIMRKDLALESTTNELEDARRALHSLRSQAVNTDHLTKLKDELAHSESSHEMAMERERAKVDQIRQEFRDVQRSHEHTVEVLESKLTEMTQLVCEKEKESLSLREKIKSLETKKYGNLRPTDSLPTNGSVSNCDKRLRSLIRILFPDYSGSVDNLDEEKLKSTIHRKCKLEYESLVKELEDVKIQLRSRQNIVTNGVFQEASNNEISNLRQNVSALKEQLQSTQAEHENQLLSQSAKIDELNRSYRALEESHKKLIASIETEYQNRISEMECELIKQRDRMAQILAEKDQELESLKRIYSVNQSTTSTMLTGDSVSHGFYQQRFAAGRSDSRISFNSLEEPYMIGGEEANSPLPFAPADPVPSPMLSHYHKEIARRDMDIQRLRVDLRRLESQLIAAQHDLISKELTNHEIVEALKDEIRKLETKSARQHDLGHTRGSDGESPELHDNIEYLKNVFQQFIRCSEPRAKVPMIKAICRALKFTPKEIDEAMLRYKS